MKKAHEERLLHYLSSRGLKKFKELDRRALILPRERNAIEVYYGLMKRYSFRLVLRDIIKKQECFTSKDLARFSSLSVVRKYLKALQEWGLVQKLRGHKFHLVPARVKSFGLTLEWFTSEVLSREFGAETLWGVRFYDTAHGGDYDVIALMEGLFCYVEVKSSPPKHIEQSEITAFFNRIDDLLPHMAIFMVDTQLRMKDKLVAMFEEELKGRYGPRTVRKYPVERMERELFRIRHQIYIINTKKELETNLRVCMRDHLKSRLQL